MFKSWSDRHWHALLVHSLFHHVTVGVNTTVPRFMQRFYRNCNNIYGALRPFSNKFFSLLLPLLLIFSVYIYIHQVIHWTRAQLQQHLFSGINKYNTIRLYTCTRNDFIRLYDHLKSLKMAIGILLPLRIAQFIFAIVVVGLSSYGMETHCWNKMDNN